MSSFADVCEHGGHWCKLCQRYVEVLESDNGLPRRCAECGSIRLRFDPPVEGFKRQHQREKTFNDNDQGTTERAAG